MDQNDHYLQAWVKGGIERKKQQEPNYECTVNIHHLRA